MTSRGDFENLSGAYALHALDENEARAFEAHLAESEEIRDEVAGLTGTAALLGLAVEPVAPPASLKASIMARLATTPQLDREPAAAASVDARIAARWFRRPATAVVGVAAAIALIIGGGIAVNAVATSITQQAAANEFAALYTVSDSQSKQAEIEGGGIATLVWSPGLASSALIVKGLDRLPADRVYQLWYIDAEGARSAGTFSVGESGSTWQLLEGRMAEGDTVGVTVEPRGGSTAPTTDPIIVIASA